MRPGNQSGFSLIENLVAVVIFSIGVVFLFQLLFSGRIMVEGEGERRIALKLAEHKMEELLRAGYSSTDSINDWTSVDLGTGTHPSSTSVTMDARGTTTTDDDLVGSMEWTVRDTSWTLSGVTTDAKVVDLVVEWPADAPLDQVRLVTLVGS